MAKARDDSLGRYDEKRDFERTPEPAAKRPRRKKGAPPIFVVHRDRKSVV